MAPLRALSSSVGSRNSRGLGVTFASPTSLYSPFSPPATAVHARNPRTHPACHGDTSGTPHRTLRPLPRPSPPPKKKPEALSSPKKTKLLLWRLLAMLTAIVSEYCFFARRISLRSSSRPHWMTCPFPPYRWSSALTMVLLSSTSSVRWYRNGECNTRGCARAFFHPPPRRGAFGQQAAPNTPVPGAGAGAFGGAGPFRQQRPAGAFGAFGCQPGQARVSVF